MAAYDEVFAHAAGWDPARVRAEAEGFRAPIAAHGATYLEELQGIAEGAAVGELDVLAINLRTEIIWAASARDAARPALPLECTAFAALPGRTGGRTLIGQTWDWLVHAAETTVVLEARQDDGPDYVTVVEAGLLAKAGMNSAGVALATNALVSAADRGAPGVPYHVLLRSILDAETVSDGLGALSRGARASSANYLLADADGVALDVEAAPGDHAELFLGYPEDDLVLHANHFQNPGFGGRDVSLIAMPDSPFRMARLRGLTARTPGRSTCVLDRGALRPCDVPARRLLPPGPARDRRARALRDDPGARDGPGGEDALARAGESVLHAVRAARPRRRAGQAAARRPRRVIQAALNGARVPMGPERLAAEAAAVAALGCRSIHLHVHDGGGRESLAAPDVAAAVAAVRTAAPGAEIGVSTGEWITADVAGAIAAWTDPLPDMASANLAEPASAAVIGALRARGVAIEAGIFSPADADALALARVPVHRVLVESGDAPPELGDDQLAVDAAIAARLDALGVAAPRLHHGEGAQTWAVIARARARGLAVPDRSRGRRDAAGRRTRGRECAALRGRPGAQAPAGQLNFAAPAAILIPPSTCARSSGSFQYDALVAERGVERAAAVVVVAPADRVVAHRRRAAGLWL